MIFRVVLILLFYSLSLFAEWRVTPKIEAGFYSPQLSGTLSNVHGSSDFISDYGYDKASASYFSVDLLVDYDYIPNLSISYFNMQENADATLDKNITVAEEVFSSKVTTLTDLSILNTIIYQDFKTKGKMFSLFGKRLYSGDVEFDIGMNVKLLSWNFEIQDKTDTTRDSAWIKVHELVPLPYVGFNYYLYRFVFHAEASALSFVEAKALNYEVVGSFRVVDNLFLSAGYLYEEFKAVEDDDTVEFTSSGYKVSFMYAF